MYEQLAPWLLWVQGTYFLFTGLWPIISIRSFQRVTGPKTDHLPTGREADHWLVMTVSVLIVAIAAAILSAAIGRRLPVEVVVLAMGASIGLTAIDVIYVSRKVIRPIYLLDAVIEIVLLAGWTTAIVI